MLDPKHFGYRPAHKVPAHVLDQIAAFHEMLPKQKSLENVMAWWDRCIEIDVSIEADRRASSYDKSRVQNLRTAVTDAIVRVRDYGYEPDTSRISLALTALQHSLLRRTIGPMSVECQKRTYPNEPTSDYMPVKCHQPSRVY
jgi:hypothetical protein